MVTPNQRRLRSQVHLEVLLGWLDMTLADGEAVALGVGPSSPIWFLIWFSINWRATSLHRPTHHRAKLSVTRK